MAKRIANRIAVLTLLALLFLAVPTAVRAAEIDVDTSKSCTLTIRSATSAGGVPGASFALYRVASVSGSRPDFAVLPAFAGYPVDWAVSSVSKWNDLALTLKGYVLADGLTPDASGTTATNGVLTLEDLPTGLYLVVGKKVQLGQKTYIPSPSFVVLPARNARTVPVSWDYAETIQPKYSLNGTGGGPDDDDTSTEERRAIKLWKDDDPVQRPKKITVSLYCDGTLYRTAVLTEAKSWRAVFDNLEKGCDWTLIEDVPDDYTVSITQEGTAFLVTNTCKQTDDQPDIPDDNPPDKDDGEPIDPPEEGSETYTNPNPDDPGEPDDDEITERVKQSKVYPGGKLPQLGLLWWPIPLLLGCSLLCVLLRQIFIHRGRRGRRPHIFLALGIVCLASAGVIVLQNLATQDSAADAAEQSLAALRVTMPLEETGVTTDAAAQQPDYLLNPDMPMPTVEIDGIAYIGVLSIPSLDLELPIAAELSNATLYKAPCRYSGSAYRDDLILAAHNYRRHFGSIHRLRAGDALAFTDVDGNVFEYTVAETEVLQADDVERMVSTDYALTLFTCTLGGQQRITVRCTAAK